MERRRSVNEFQSFYWQNPTDVHGHKSIIVVSAAFVSKNDSKNSATAFKNMCQRRGKRLCEAQ